MKSTRKYDGSASLAMVVWMNQPSHYQDCFFRQLSSRGVDLLVVYAAEVPAARAALGWDSSWDSASYRTAILHRWFWPWQIVSVLWKRRNNRHLVNGIWAVKPFLLVCVMLCVLRIRYFIHSEAANVAHETRARRALKRAMAAPIMQRCSGIFAIGRKAEEYYASLGFAGEKVFRFSYFQESHAKIETPRPFRPDGVTVLYLGQFVARKRVGDLISAFGALRPKWPNVTLLLAGTGPLRDDYIMHARNLAPEGSVEVMGSIPPAAVNALLQSVGVLVLPSEFDGWGLVVNEALQAGVPVIVSSGCGAAEVVETTGWGHVFKTGNVEQLTLALEKVLADPAKYRPDRDQADALIGCCAMTQYFLDCLCWAETGVGLKPKAPWLERLGIPNQAA